MSSWMLRITRFPFNPQENQGINFTCCRNNHMPSALQPVEYMTMMMICSMTHPHMHLRQTQKIRKLNLQDNMMDQQYTYTHACIVYMSHNQ